MDSVWNGKVFFSFPMIRPMKLSSQSLPWRWNFRNCSSVQPVVRRATIVAFAPLVRWMLAVLRVSVIISLSSVIVRSVGRFSRYSGRDLSWFMVGFSSN